MSGKASDRLIKYPYCGSHRAGRMSNIERAAQFSPFAALTGFDGVLSETARVTNERLDVTEDRQNEINACLIKMLENFPEKTAAKITYFVPDKHKSGGEYKTAAGLVRWIDEGEMTVIFSDNSAVPIEDIYNVEIICGADKF